MKNSHKIQLYVFLFAYCVSQLATCISSEEKVRYSTDNEIVTKELFEAKIMEIEAKVVHLETKVAKQENVIKALQNGCEVSRAEHVSVNKTDNKKNDRLEKNFIPRTCQEAYDQGMIITSGLYIIDPDGQNVGGESEDPIEVYCDTGAGSAVKTLIGHDTETSIDVNNCNDAGCYKRDIHYYASDKQIEALIELSNECHQYFKYECIAAPFEYQDEQVSWWDDRNENQQFFWSGKYTSPNAHTCDCGIYENCFGGETKKCNCDSGLPEYQVDSGIISDKTTLPVKRLNFGHTIEGSGLHTLGKFECSGKVFISGMPKTCADLRGLGHALSGMYLVMGNNSIENIYCDFSKLQSDNDFQKQIGKVEVQSSPTFFYVQRYSTIDYGIITFQIEHVNTGNAMNLFTGKFTAPVFGTYFFSFSGIGSMDFTLGDGKLQVSLMKNNQPIGKGEARLTQGLSTDTLTLQSTVYLQARDQVWVYITGNEEMHLFDDGGHYTHFTGWLLQEDIVETLNYVN